jgi:hypothetical protein
MTVEGIGFTDTVSLAQTIGIVGTRIMTLALATTY